MIYRTDDAARWGFGKGANLLPVEVDGNFWELASRLAAVEENPAAPAEISNIQVAASQMTVFLSDGRTLGPYTLPTAMIRYRGDWTAGSSYQELDLILVPNNGVYLVLRAHAAGTVFDPNAVDAQGAPLYRWLFPSRTDGIEVDAPSDGVLYGRLNAAWVEVPATPTWETLAGKPAAFPPSAHTHLWAEITDKPATFPPSGHGHPWGEVTGKPATIDALPPSLGAAGQIIKVNSTGTGLLWAADETAGTAETATNLDGLSDVVITAPATGQVLKFNGTEWVNAADEAGTGGGATTLDGLSDVVVTTPAVAQVLRFNGTEWVNVPLDWTDLANKPATFPPSAHTHPWADVTDKPATFPPSVHAHPWSEVSEKPATVAALPAALGAEKQVLKVSGGALVWSDLLGGAIGAHKYWRLDAHEAYGAPVSGYDISVFTLEFRQGGVEHSKTGGAAFGTITNPSSAFDGSNSSNATGTWANNGRPITVGYQFASAVEVDDIRIGTYFPGTWGPATPALFDILYSDDGVNFTKVVTIDDRGNTVLDYKAFPVPTTTAEPVDATTVKGVAPSDFALTLLDDVDAVAARTTLGAPDIEKGTFTPVVVGDVTPGAATYTFQWGDYTRVGDIVHVSLRVNWSGHTGTGAMRISGLPFVSRGHRNALSIWPDALNTGNANQYPVALMWRSDSYIQLYGVPLGGPDAEATMLPLPASGNVIISGSYHV